MKLTFRMLLAPLVAALGFMPCGVIAGKPGGGSSIRVEPLGVPSGANSTHAYGINETGTSVAGSVVWAVNPGYNFAARWNRPSGGDAWQFEDLRSLMPSHKTSSASRVNNAGTVVVRSEDFQSVERWFVITSTNQAIALELNARVSDLDEGDALVGARHNPGGAPADQPLYWASPTAVPEVLPALAPGFGGSALWFQGADIIGTLDDESGRWLVRWTGASGARSVTRLARLPPGREPTGLGSSGRLALMTCPVPCPMFGWRAAAWDMPFDGSPTYLPVVAGDYSWTGPVMGDGTILGVSVASNGTDMLPVMWPTLTTLTQLPLLSGGRGGFPNDFNDYGQVVGYVRVVVKGRAQNTAVLWTLP